jgi:YidC/Oxa1 family membrane protein insertase
MYVFPIMFAVFGINFPVGVLVYWLTTNVWTLGQQMYVIKRNPTPGSLAYQQRQDKLRAQGKIKDDPVEVEAKQAAEEARARRAQPKRQTKAKRSTAGTQPAVKKTSGSPKSGGGQQKSQAHGKKKPQSAKTKK